MKEWLQRNTRASMRPILSIPIARRVLKWLQLEFYIRFNQPNYYLRVRYSSKLRNLSNFMLANEMTGGYITGKGEFYLKTPDGIYLYYNFRSDRHTLADGQGLDFTRAFNPSSALEKFIMEYLRDGMVVFDVGANNGYYYSLKIARQFRNCQVFAFEPDPRILHHLERNIAINNANNVRVIQQALSNRTGKARMTALLGASNFLVDDSHTSGATVSVESNTLDNFVAQNRIHRLDFIKVDIEGQECNFLLGAERSLARFKPLLVLELNDDLLRRSGASTASALSLLKAADYGCFKVRGSYDAVAAPKTRVRSIRKRARGWLDPAS